MKKLYRDTISILTPRERSRFSGLIFLDLLITILDLAFLAFLLFVVAFYTGNLSNEMVPAQVEEIINGHPLVLIGSFVVLFALKNFIGFLVFKSQLKYVYGVASRLSEKMLGRFLDGSYTDFVNIDSSVHTRRISQQTVEFSHHVLRGIQQIISNSILVAMTVIAIVVFNAVLFGLVLAMLLPAILLIAYLTKKKLTGIRESGKSHRERSMQYLNEALAGFVETNIYQGKEFFTRRYIKYQEKFNAGLAQQLVTQNLPARMMEVFAVLGLFFLIVVDSYLVESGSLLLLIGAFMAAAYKIIPGIARILNNMQQVRIFSYTIDDLQNEPAKETAQPAHQVESLRSIEFAGVGFSYGGQTVLENAGFKIRSGNFAGLSAPSGRGKTTVLNLLLGFLEPGTGTILFNEIPANDADRRSFWPRISYCRQQAFVLHDSIQNNIALNENPDMERLWSAINIAGLDWIVNQSERGLDTIITENGKNISGGQRQRLMMARAFYRDADLYILDEPFNELDREAIAKLIAHLQTLAAGGKMILLVTHDEQALKHCTQIIRLNET